MTTINFSASALTISGRVDREAGIIRGATVITSGITAKGHDLEVDDTLLNQIIECGNAKGRVQVKLNHRDPQALQSICGYITGFRHEGNKVVADWHLLKTHDEFARIIERAERMPECFGLSCAFRGPEKGQKGSDGKKYARCEELIAVDVVSLPAANPNGLFAASNGREKKRAVPAAVKAGISAAASGAALGLIPAFRRGSTLKAVARSVGIGAGAGAAVGGLGTALGGAILGKPREDEGGAITKRAALGGGIAGALGGATAGALALRTRLGRRLLVRASKDWRPARWARQAGLPGAVAIGGVGGGIIGAAHAADEGQQVDTIESLKKQRRRQNFSSYIEDVTLMSLPTETRETVEKLVTAKKSTQFVQYGMTVRELLAKADPFNLRIARAQVRALSAKACIDEVQRQLGDKFILLLNDRIIDGHHFLAKAERARVSNALMVLDLTPARFQLAAAGKSLEFAVDPRARDSLGQFAGAAAGAADPNSMAAAYGNVVAQKAQRLDFLARVMKARRRVFGNEAQSAPAAAGVAVSATVPRIERASEFIKRKSGAAKVGLLQKLEALSPTIQFRRKDDDEPNRVASGALIAGAGLAGAAVGSRLGAKLAQVARYRRAKPGEDLVGKVVGVKRNVTVAGHPVFPVMHTGIAMPGRRVVHSAPGKGLGDSAAATFRKSSKAGGSSTVYVARGSAAASPEAIRKAAAGVKDRPWRCASGNCEHVASHLIGEKPRSPQLRGALAGAAVGGAVAGGTASAATKQEEDDERRRRRMRTFAARIAKNEIIKF